MTTKTKSALQDCLKIAALAPSGIRGRNCVHSAASHQPKQEISKIPSGNIGDS